MGVPSLGFLNSELKNGFFILLPDGTEIRIGPTEDNPSVYKVNVIQGNSMVHIENGKTLLCWDFTRWRNKPETTKVDEIVELISEFSTDEIQELLSKGGIIFSSCDKTRAIGVSF